MPLIVYFYLQVQNNFGDFLFDVNLLPAFRVKVCYIKNKYYFCTLLKDIISMSCTSTSALNAAQFFCTSTSALNAQFFVLFPFVPRLVKVVHRYYFLFSLLILVHQVSVP